MCIALIIVIEYIVCIFVLLVIENICDVMCSMLKLCFEKVKDYFEPLDDSCLPGFAAQSFIISGSV